VCGVVLGSAQGLSCITLAGHIELSKEYRRRLVIAALRVDLNPPGHVLVWHSTENINLNGITWFALKAGG
jgi:hypothetical protein